MAKNRLLHHAVRYALATATAAAGVSALYAQGAPAPGTNVQPLSAAQTQPSGDTLLAQTTPPAPATTETAQATAPPPATAAGAPPVSEVVVTGSRLRESNLTAISPVTTVSATDIQSTGLTRVEDVLNNFPMVFAGENATTSNGADGTATLDLRGLGNERTLVLVNGLRLGPGAGDGRNFSDINQIPPALIQRVEILTGGASSVYGADAVAGVVNFILDTHFDGVRVDGGYHFFQHSNDNPNNVQGAVSAADFVQAPNSTMTGYGKSASVLVGSNFADDKGNATAYITYDNQGPALQSKFDYSACSLTSGKTGLACGGSGTSAKAGAGGEFLGYSASGVGFLDNTVDGSNNTFRPFTSPNDLFNYGPLNFYETPEERWTAGTFLSYDVNSHAQVYAQVMLMRNSQLAQIAPSGDFGVASFTACGDPLLNASEQAVVCDPANQALQGNPFETYNGVNYPGLNLYILRRNVEGGNRVFASVIESMHTVVGVKGDINDVLSYDFSAIRSGVDQQIQNENYLSNSAVEESLNVLGTAANPVCGGPSNARGAGPLVLPSVAPSASYTGGLAPTGVAFAADSACVPWNIWQANGVTPQALSFLQIPAQAQDSVVEYNMIGSVTADLSKYAKLPTADAGLQVNVGLEWREDKANFNPDLISEQGSAAGTGGPTVPVAGEVAVWEGFTELRLPLVQNQFLANDLSVEAGYRYSSYNLGFNTDTYKFGLEWAPVKDVRLRGSFNRSVRAPDINELYSPSAVVLDGSTDPCSGAAPAGSLAGCEASGVSAAQYGHISANAASQYNGLEGGNPALQPEIADTWSTGVVFTPQALPSLSLSADWFDIKINDVIERVGGNAIINGCVFSGEFCNLVHRASNGSLWLSPLGYVSDLDINEGSLGTRGIDFKGRYSQDLPAGFGALVFGLEATRLISLTTTPVIGQGSYDCAGYFGDLCGGGNSTFRSVFNGTWETPWDAINLTARWRYMSAQGTEQLNPSPYLAGKKFYAPLAHIPAYSWFDLSASVNVYKSLSLMVGVNNIFDKDPPLVLLSDCSTSSPGGANCNGNTFPGVYDAMGRYMYATLTAKF